MPNTEQWNWSGKRSLLGRVLGRRKSSWVGAKACSTHPLTRSKRSSAAGEPEVQRCLWNWGEVDPREAVRAEAGEVSKAHADHTQPEAISF